MDDPVKVGTVFINILGWFMLVFSLLWIFATEVMFISDVGVYTGQTWTEFLASSPQEATLYIITKKLLGIQLTALSVLILFINTKSYSKGEKWAWWALLIAGGLSWGSMLVYRFVIGYIASSGIITFILGLALLGIGLAIPAKVILRKEKEQSK